MLTIPLGLPAEKGRPGRSPFDMVLHGRSRLVSIARQNRVHDAPVLRV